MSHPPETSRELAERIHDLWMNGEWEDINPYAVAAALIEAWVRVREVEAQIAEAKRWQLKWHEDITGDSGVVDDEIEDSWGAARMTALESALVTARKQQETL